MQKGTPGSDFIGPYRVVKQLSVTASVQVHLAREDGPGGFPRDVVLKVVPNVSGEGARDIEELTRETTTCALLTHPGIVRIRHFFQHDGALVLVTEHVDGIPLAALLAARANSKKRPISDDAVLHIGASICDALAHAHALDDEAGARAPIVHRAVNPANVLIARDGAVKLDGFGFAKILGGVGTDTTGSFKWTPAYMAPEQVTEQPATPKIDVYAAGLILWELLTGRRSINLPHDPLAIEATLRAVATRNPPALATIRADLPRDLSQAVDAALISEPEKRTITCAQMSAWIRKAGRLDVGKRELRELVIRTQAAPAGVGEHRTLVGVAPPPATAAVVPVAGLPALPPRAPVPPPDGPPTVRNGAARPASEESMPRLPAIVAPLMSSVPRLSDVLGSVALETDASPDPGSVSMSVRERVSLVERLRVRTPWRLYPVLGAWVGLTLVLAGLIAKLAFSGGRTAPVSAATLALQAPSPEPVTSPGPSEPSVAPDESPAPSSEPSPADDTSETMKQRGLGYLTVHSAAAHANVYVNLKLRGKVEERLTVACGSKFVSIGVPANSRGEPAWLAPGKMMLIPCGGPLETTMDPRALRTR
jgi:serine/threonine-protein kinase